MQKVADELKPILLVLAVIVSHTLTTSAQAIDTLLYKQMPGWPFVFISEPFVNEAPNITDSLFDEVARGIRFQVNRTELQKTDPFVASYNDTLVPMLRQSSLVLRGVFLKGAASPEGSYENNVRLSRERARRLTEFLGSGFRQPVNEDLLNTRVVTEDYAYLVKLMGQAGDKEYEQVKAIWESCDGDERLCKRRLRALNGGRTWNRLLRVYFPELRQSRVVLWYAPNPRHIDSPEIHFTTELPRTDTLPRLYYRAPEPVAVTTEYARRHMIAVRTNLVQDLLYVPQCGFVPGANVQLEYYPLSGHYTYNAGVSFYNHRRWGSHMFFQLRDVQLELRRYFRGDGDFVGPFVSAYAEGTVYGIGFGESKGWEGEGGGAGIGIGYTRCLTRKGDLRLELSLNVGAFVTRYDPYVWGNPITGSVDGQYYYKYYGSASDFRKRNHRFIWVGPTNAGVHLTYDIIYRKKEVSR